MAWIRRIGFALVIVGSIMTLLRAEHLAKSNNELRKELTATQDELRTLEVMASNGNTLLVDLAERYHRQGRRYREALDFIEGHLELFPVEGLEAYRALLTKHTEELQMQFPLQR